MAVCIAETTLQGQEAAHIYTRDLGVRNTGTPQGLPCSSVAQTFHQEQTLAIVLVMHHGPRVLKMGASAARNNLNDFGFSRILSESLGSCQTQILVLLLWQRRI